MSSSSGMSVTNMRIALDFDEPRARKFSGIVQGIVVTIRPIPVTIKCVECGGVEPIVLHADASVTQSGRDARGVMKYRFAVKLKSAYLDGRTITRLDYEERKLTLRLAPVAQSAAAATAAAPDSGSSSSSSEETSSRKWSPEPDRCGARYVSLEEARREGHMGHLSKKRAAEDSPRDMPSPKVTAAPSQTSQEAEVSSSPSAACITRTLLDRLSIHARAACTIAEAWTNSAQLKHLQVHAVLADICMGGAQEAQMAEAFASAGVGRRTYTMLRTQVQQHMAA